MQEVFEKIIEKLEENSFEMGKDSIPAHYVRLNRAIEIVKQETEKFGRDTNVGSNGNGVLKFANLLKELCCKKDEDYDNPVISPKYLNDTIENLLLDYNEQYNNGWIPCSERLPECENKYGWVSCIVSVIRSHYPTSTYDICDSPYDENIVMHANYHVSQKIWHLECDEQLNALMDIEDAPLNCDYVIAWQPLPEPYTKWE